MLNIGEYRRKSDRLADHLPWAALVGRGIVLNKDGSFQRTFRFSGPDLESATEAELVAACARINNVLRRFGSGWTLFFEAERFEAAGYPESDFPDPASKLIDDERLAGFEVGTDRHFDSAYYLTLVFMPPADATSRAERALIERDQIQQSRDWQAELSTFVSETNKAFDLFGQIVPDIEMFDDAQTLTYLHGTVSTKRHLVLPPDVSAYLDAILADTPLSGGLEPILGDQHLRTVTVLGFPNATRPGLLDALNHLDFPYRWTTRFIALDKAEANKALVKIRRQWFNKRKSIAVMLREVIHNEPVQLLDTDADNKVVDADQALQALGGDHVSFGCVTITVTVMDENATAVDEKVRAIERVINGLGFTTIRESINAVEAWLGTVPGHLYANVRQPLIHTLNLSHLMPLSSVWAGPERNDHLDGPPLFYAETTGSTPFRFSTHVGDVGHMLIVGPTGAGKSVLLSLMAMQFRRYANSQVYIFDKGKSARAATLAMGGAHHELGSDGTLAFQPLAHIDDDAERSWAADWIAGLLDHEKVAVTPDIKEQVWAALNSLTTAPQSERTLTGLSLLLQSNALRSALLPYTLEGPFGRLLDAAEDSLALKDVQCFETETLMHQAAVVPPVLTYLFHRLEERFDGRPTLLILDEAWVFLDNPLFAARIREWLKVLRKKNVSVVFATQSLADIANSSIAPAIIESCPQRIFLPNDRAIEPQSRIAYQQFGLNERQIELISRAVLKRQYYLQSRRGNRLFELGLGAIALAFCGSSSPADQTLIDKIISEYGEENFADVFLTAKGLDWAADLLTEFSQKGDLHMKRAFKYLATPLTVALLSVPAVAQWEVFDPTNFAENVLQASRELQQIENQIQSLQNEATMLSNMSKNLQALGLNELGPILSDLNQVQSIINQPFGIGFDLGTTQAQFSQYWPGSYSVGTSNAALQADGVTRWTDAMQSFLQTLSIGAQVIRNVENDSTSLSALVGASQGAAGNLEATQATNQLLALSTKQQLQTQSLLAAQYRAEALNLANEQEAEVQGRAEFANFAGSANAYTPE